MGSTNKISLPQSNPYICKKSLNLVFYKLVLWKLCYKVKLKFKKIDLIDLKILL